MKATLRKTGEYMFTLRVDFNVGRGRIASLLLRSMKTPADVPTRAAVIEAVRAALHQDGVVSTGDLDDVSDEDADAMQAHVDRLFPELLKGTEHIEAPQIARKFCREHVVISKADVKKILALAAKHKLLKELRALGVQVREISPRGW